MGVTIRVNLDKDNIDQIDLLLKCLDEQNLLNNVNFCVGVVTHFGFACSSVEDRVLTEEDFNKIMKQKKIADIIPKSKNFLYRTPSDLVGCVATALHSYVVAPGGDLYKCSKNIGDAKESCGNILNPDPSHPNFVKWVNLDNLYSPTCADCSLVPVCRGNVCAYDILFNSWTNENCKKKENHPEYLDRLWRIYSNQVNKQTNLKKGE